MINRFPHCDSTILHSKKSGCVYCNKHPDWQELREVWHMNFTGEDILEKDGIQMLPCPSTLSRPINKVHAWHGNVPTTQEDIDNQKKEWAEWTEKMHIELDKLKK